MTVLNLTITEQRAMLSQDTGVTPVEEGQERSAGVAEDEEEKRRAFADAWGADGTTQEDSADHMVKVAGFPDLHLMVGGVGGAGVYFEWLEAVLELGAEDLDDLVELAPEALVRIVNETTCRPASLSTVVVGWSPKEQRVLGYLFDGSQGFRPLRLDEGHTMVPPYDAEDEYLDSLSEAWEAALGGDEEAMLDFHQQLFGNQLRGYRKGRLRAEAALSNRLQVAILTPDRVEVDRGYELG